MKVQFKAAVREKEFDFKEGDEIKIIATSFLYATEDRPERIYTGKLLELEEYGFFARLESVTVHPYSEEERMPGEAEQLSGEEEFFSFEEIEDVLRPDEEYPNRKDPLIRFALEGPSD